MTTTTVPGQAATCPVAVGQKMCSLVGGLGARETSDSSGEWVPLWEGWVQGELILMYLISQ